MKKMIHPPDTQTEYQCISARRQLINKSKSLFVTLKNELKIKVNQPLLFFAC